MRNNSKRKQMPTRRGGSKPTITQLPEGSIRVRGEELWASALGGDLGQGVAAKVFAPGSSNIQRLDQLASLYEEYVLNSCVVKYCPSVGTTVDGRLRYGIDYVPGTEANPLGKLPQTPAEVDALTPGINGPVWKAGTVTPAMNKVMKQKRMLVGKPAADTSGFALVYSNESDRDAPGEFRIKYDITFHGVGQGVTTGGSLGTLSGTFVESTTGTSMHIDSQGILGSYKWGTVGRRAALGFADGQPIPAEIATIDLTQPADAARQTGPDGASNLLGLPSLSGSGVLRGGSLFAVEVELICWSHRGENCELSPEDDTSSGTGGFIPTQWIMTPERGSGDESQMSLLSNTPFKLSSLSGAIIDSQLSLVLADNYNGGGIAIVSNSDGPDPEAPNMCRTFSVGQIRIPVDTPVSNFRFLERQVNDSGEAMTHVMRDINDNGAREVFSSSVRTRITAVNEAARSSLSAARPMTRLN